MVITKKLKTRKNIVYHVERIVPNVPSKPAQNVLMDTILKNLHINAVNVTIPAKNVMDQILHHVLNAKTVFTSMGINAEPAIVIAKLVLEPKIYAHLAKMVNLSTIDFSVTIVKPIARLATAKKNALIVLTVIS